jgi:sec-independent protein translocase protein TatC
MSDEKPSGIQETFISHLVELRTRLVRASAVVLVVFIVLFTVWPGASVLYDFMAQPMLHALPEGSKMIATGVITPFMVPMKITMVAALMISLPWVLYQAWAFVAPGLYMHEKRLVAPLIFSSTILFILGVAFCYYLVFGTVFKFISDFAPKSISVAPDIENYLDFVLMMCLAFGLTFEVPVVVIVLVRMGIVSVEKLKAIRSYVIVGAFVIAAIVTPPDIMSQLFLAIPLCLLYEVGILLAPLFVKSTQAPEESTESS